MRRIALWLFLAGVALAQSPEGGNPERPAIVAGRVIARDGRPLANVGVEALRLDNRNGSPYLKNPKPGAPIRSDDRGEFRISIPPGEFYVRTLLDDTQFANSYYPGSLDINLAKLIRVRAGNVYEGINIVHAGGKTHFISGTFTGAPNQGPLWCAFNPRGGPRGIYGPQPLPIIHIGEGLFQITLATGSWDVYAARTTGGPINSPSASITHIGKFSVDIHDADVDSLVLDFKPTTGVRGQILAPPGHKLNGQITMEGLSDIPEGFLNAQIMTRAIGATGVFEFTGAPSGAYGFRLRNLPQGVYVSDILTGTTSVFDSPLKVTSTPVSDIRVLLKDDGGSIDGVVLAEDGKPVPNQTVTAVPSAALRWNTMAYAYAITDKLGRFAMKDVAPGSYELFAWEYFPEGRGKDDVVVAPDFLDRYKDDAIPVVVESTKTIANVQLRRITWK